MISVKVLSELILLKKEPEGGDAVAVPSLCIASTMETLLRILQRGQKKP